MNRYERQYGGRVARRQPRENPNRPKTTGGQKFLFALIVILYTALMIWITFNVVINRSNSGRQFDYSYTDDRGNSVNDSVYYAPVDGVHNILVFGMDRGAMLTDVTMLVNIDANTHRVSVMQIPRDTYVSSFNSSELYTNKFNELFSDTLMYLGSDSDESYLEAIKTVEGSLEHNLCIEIGNVVLVDLEGFVNIVDAVGGVDVDVPVDMVYDDPYQDLHIDLRQGYQHINGEQAEMMVRFRNDYIQGDMGRVNAQKIFLAAMFSKIKSTFSEADIPAISSMASEISRNITTDMTVSDIIYYARALLSCDLGNVNMMTLPGNITTSNFVMNREVTIRYINTYFNTYDRDITVQIFDPDGMFVSDDESVSEIYYGDGEELYDSNVYSGESVIGDSIDIPTY